MAEPDQQSLPVIIPTINHSTYQRLPSAASHDNPHPREAKTFLIPKHNTYPLALQRQWQQYRRFIPRFEHFDLSHLFTTVEISQEDIEQFWQIKNRQEEEPNSPVGQRSNEEQQGSNGIFDKNPPGHLFGNRIDGNGDSKNCRSKEKGLRRLSQRAYQIVIQMKSASYKEVAKKLVSELNQRQLKKGAEELAKREKDEKNIKRRVYDALNVLIALGVLKKDGRKIVEAHPHLSQLQQSLALKLRRANTEKQSSLQAKRQKLTNLLHKQQIYQDLFIKHQGQSQHSKIQFPFLVLENQRYGTVEGRGKEGSCTELNWSWLRGKEDKGNFDIDFLIQYNKRLSLIKH